MSDIGYIKLYRKLQDWKWFQEPKTLQLFIYLLLNANFTEKEWQGIKVLPGQLITSVNTLCDKTGQTIQSIRTATDRLKSTGEITIKTTNRFSLITVANWALYQSQDDLATSKTTTDSTNKQQTNNKQTTTPKEGEEGKKEKKDNIPYQEVVDLWKSTVKTLPPASRITQARKDLIRVRYAEGGLELFKTVFEKVHESEFLSGRNGKWSACGFDWVLKSEHWTKIIEGNYDNKHQSAQIALPEPPSQHRQKVTYKSEE